MSEVFNKNSKQHLRKGALCIVIIILLLLTILSGALLAVRLVDYINLDSREVMLQSNATAELDVFSVRYENQTGQITVEGLDGQKVVAPGTSVDHTFRLHNADKTAIDYEMVPHIRFTSDHKIPIKVRLLRDDGRYIIGDAKTFVAADKIEDISEQVTLAKGDSAEYLFQWKWDFESGDDSYDTALGSTAIDVQVGLEAGFTVRSVANTNISVNGGVMQSGLGDILYSGIATLLLLIAVVLLLWVIISSKKRKNKQI